MLHTTKGVFQMKVKDEGYYIIHGWMINRLKLSGNELSIYAIIYGFSQDNSSVFSGSIAYLSEWLNISRSTVIRALKSLTDNGCIIKNEEVYNGVKMNTYKYSETFLIQKLPNIDKENTDNLADDNIGCTETGGIKMTPGMSNEENTETQTVSQCENTSSMPKNTVKSTVFGKRRCRFSVDATPFPYINMDRGCQNDTGSIKMTPGMSDCHGGSIKMTPNNIEYNIDYNKKESISKKEENIDNPPIHLSG